MENKNKRVNQWNKVSEIVKGNRIQMHGPEIGGGEDFYPKFVTVLAFKVIMFINRKINF